MAGLSTREQCPFFELELQLHCVKEKWLSVTNKDGDDNYYSLDGALDAANEKASNNNLIVSGPKVACYLKELGNQMHSKLTRGKITGIQSSSSILIQWQVMLNIMRLIKRYGWKVVAETKKNKEKLFTVTISGENCSGKVWHSKRTFCPKENIANSAHLKILTRNLSILVAAKWWLLIVLPL